MLDCIRSTAQAAENIAAHYEQNMTDLNRILDQRTVPVSQIVFVGSGTSSTASLPARAYVERTSGLRTSVLCPNEFLYNTSVYDPDALYVFVSQTGTSMVCRKAMEKIRELGYDFLVISETRKTPMALEHPSIPLDCGIEEYPMRTVGYSATVLTEMALALVIGHRMGRISAEAFHSGIESLAQAGGRQPAVIDRTMTWLDGVKRKLLRSDLIVFTGADELAGVALEGAMKVWETLQKASVGYELEEGLHGPNYGYDHRHCVVVLNNGKREDAKARALKRYMEEVWGNGLLVGPEAVDAQDLALELPDPDTVCIDFATVVQTIAYRLALDEGRDLTLKHDNSRMERYFRTHS